MKKFQTKLEYTDRRTKADYVFDKYNWILRGRILDVGADAIYLKPYILKNGGGAEYLGIGLGENIDLEIDLKTANLPFDNRSFDTVLCLDVLEHLEAIHKVFGELCRVADQYVILSLPNPWATFFAVLIHGDYSQASSIKHYGLPLEPPEDRHRWFFNEKEAKGFISYNAEKAGFEVIQFDSENEDKPMGGFGMKGLLGRWLLKRIFRPDIDQLGLHHGTLWCVLKRKNN